MAYSGFCVGGVNWPRPELDSAADPAQRLEVVRRAGTEEARMTHEQGGNLLRAFHSVKELFEDVVPGPDLDLALGVSGPESGQAIYRRPFDERVDAVDRIAAALDLLLATAQDAPALEARIARSALDAYLAGVELFNAELADPGLSVGLLLTMVAPPPRWIVEAPSASTLRHLGRAESFDSLWERYVTLHAALHRAFVRRFVAQRPRIGGRAAMRAFEIGNEPDYMWTPEEVKIETGSDELVYPLWKYVTELHLSQVPEDESGAPAFELSGPVYRAQDAEWSGQRTASPGRVLEFDWGAKFDWYVRCFADLQQRVADAIRDEADAHGVEVEIVSGSVTHNNVDYLVRMHRANPRAFEATTKIGIHPYHWPRNDVWDASFVDSVEMDDWTSSSPREYASAYFKRFDFLEQLAALLHGRRRSVPRELRGFANAIAGKKLWITEFGFATKALGAHNAPVAEYTRFIRPRAQIGAAAGHPAAIWEDLWDEFTSQVDHEYLVGNEVECLLVYALRELGRPGFDMDDEDRMNFALLHRDGTPRIEAGTLDGIRELLGTTSGKGGGPRPGARPGLELHRRPWREASLPEDAAAVTTMLSVEERQLLYWLTSTHYTGAGAIVDGGCFVGGSTLALAEGLRANTECGDDDHVDVFDLFEVEPYMAEMYFPEEGRSPGESFRPMFDENTAPVRDLIDVHAGDLMKLGWSGGPIEILFIDIAKSWDLNEVLVRQFFPSLIPDRSVVVQQDFAFALIPWVAITMEHLADYFEPTAFAEQSSVVYVCRAPVPREVKPASLRELPLDRKLALIDRAARRFRGYPRGILECAKATILTEEGDHAAARAHLDGVRAGYADDQRVIQALELQERLQAAAD